MAIGEREKVSKFHNLAMDVQISNWEMRKRQPNLYKMSIAYLTVPFAWEDQVGKQPLKHHLLHSAGTDARISAVALEWRPGSRASYIRP